ncbi:anti-sigma factor [Kineococcus sp. G2]|uniref:anti-sigma factor n=1 Tax=Kineococcus sp. G2 TaxID=3127484 RepID=UPI00301B8A24
MLPPDPGGHPPAPGPHLGEDELALLALGEDVEGAPEHLTACAACRAEVASLREVTAAVRSAPTPPAVPVPAGVWEAVARETGVRAVPGGGAGQAPAGPGDAEGAAVAPGAEPVATVLPAAPPRGRSRRSWLALAAAFLVGTAAGVGASRLAERDAPVPAAQRVLASTELAPLGAGAAAGTATVASVDGHRHLGVDVRGVDAPGEAVLEVWLLDPAGGGLLSLGTLTGERLDVVLPDVVDLTRFAVVDVSREPLDGDPGHSSDSVLRGELTPRA